jgi:hypothetical protein
MQKSHSGCCSICQLCLIFLFIPSLSRFSTDEAVVTYVVMFMFFDSIKKITSILLTFKLQLVSYILEGTTMLVF